MRTTHSLTRRFLAILLAVPLLATTIIAAAAPDSATVIEQGDLICMGTGLN